MKKNIPILIAGIIMTGTTILHLTGGQMDHVVPFLASELSETDKAVWLSVWHMVSIILLVTAFYLVKQGLNPQAKHHETMRFIAWLNVLFAMVFMIVSAVRGAFAPQWILFLPIGLLVLFGLKRKEQALQ